MAKRVHQHPNLIFSVGTQVVTLRNVIGQKGRTLHPRGSVGVVVKSPRDLEHSYRVSSELLSRSCWPSPPLDCLWAEHCAVR